MLTEFTCHVASILGALIVKQDGEETEETGIIAILFKLILRKLTGLEEDI